MRDSPRSLILRNARVVDPADSRILDGSRDVVIEDGLIQSICASGTASVADPDKAEPIVVDLAGKYLCPCASHYDWRNDNSLTEAPT